MFSKACLQALVSVIMNIGEIKNKWKTQPTWTKGMFTGYTILIRQGEVLWLLYQRTEIKNYFDEWMMPMGRECLFMKKCTLFTKEVYFYASQIQIKP